MTSFHSFMSLVGVLTAWMVPEYIKMFKSIKKK